jgi:hypothetical protein
MFTLNSFLIMSNYSRKYKGAEQMPESQSISACCVKVVVVVVVGVHRSEPKLSALSARRRVYTSFFFVFQLSLCSSIDIYTTVTRGFKRNTHTHVVLYTEQLFVAVLARKRTPPPTLLSK